MARVNINIAITAMITEKPLRGNHSSTVCLREYELETSSTIIFNNSTRFGETKKSVIDNAGRDTFDWTNRQSGLILGTRAVPT